MTKPDEYLLTGCLWLAGELGLLRLRRWWGVAPPLLRRRVVLDMTPLSQMCGPSYQPHKWAQRLPAIKHNKLISGTNRHTCISSSIFCFMNTVNPGFQYVQFCYLDQNSSSWRICPCNCNSRYRKNFELLDNEFEQIFILGKI